MYTIYFFIARPYIFYLVVLLITLAIVYIYVRRIVVYAYVCRCVYIYIYKYIYIYIYVVSDESEEPTSCLGQPIVAHCCEVMYFGCFDFRGEYGFLNWDASCVCVVDKQLELLEFVFDSVYIDLLYDEISTTFTSGSVWLCCVSSPVVVLGLSVRLS